MFIYLEGTKLIDSYTLSNGAQIVVEEIPYLRSAAIGVYIKVGSRYETSYLEGASHFVEHMLFKGTSKKTARQIAESFESIGGHLNAFTSKENTCLYARTLDEDIYSAMDIIFEMLFDSQFNEKDFKTEKEVIIEEINMYEDMPDELIHDIFSQKFWEGHPMGHSILGTQETVSNMERNMLYKYYKEYYVPSNILISIAGNLERSKVRDFLEARIAGVDNIQPVYTKQAPPTSPRFINMLSKDIEQVQITIGGPGLTFNHEDRYTQTVMNSILGGGLSSRLFQNIREELGLAYSVYSSPANYSDTGMYSINIGTGPRKLATFFEAFYKEITDFVNAGVSEEEIKRTQKLIKSNMFLGLESVMNRMMRSARSMLNHNKIITADEVINKINAVNAEKVQELAVNLLDPQKISLAAIGNEKVLPVVEKEYLRWMGK